MMKRNNLYRSETSERSLSDKERAAEKKQGTRASTGYKAAEKSAASFAYKKDDKKSTDAGKNGGKFQKRNFNGISDDFYDKKQREKKKPSGKGRSDVQYGKDESARFGKAGVQGKGIKQKNTMPQKPVEKNTAAKSRCPYAAKCGGCTMIDVPYDEQIREKESIVQELIGDFGPVEPMIRMKNPGRYRNKVTSVFGIDSHKKPVCGVYRQKSHDIVPVKTCLIENRTADGIVQSVFSLLPSFGMKVYNEETGLGMVRAVQVRCAHATHEVMVTIVTNGPAFPSKKNFVQALLEKEPEITTIVQNINDKYTTMILGDREKVLYGSGYIEDELLGKRFRLSSRSFYQVNAIQTEKLYNVAIDMAGLSGKERVLDAYCGIGTIGICASDRAGEVIGVELNEKAVQDAQENAKRNHAENVQFHADDAGRFMMEMASKKEKIDVLFMDPPRSGASFDFLQSVLAMGPKKIVYVSCNPETLADNLAFLEDGGYTMKKAVPVDMFPYTENIEVATLLLRSSHMPEAKGRTDADPEG